MITIPQLKKKVIKALFLGMALLLPCLGTTSTEEARKAPVANDQITMKWQEFQELLHLDQKSVVLSLEEFQRLSSQTSVNVKPQQILKKGQVRLTRKQFQKLVNSMIAPGDKGSELDETYILQAGIYNGVVKQTHTQFNTDFEVAVFKKRNTKNVSVRLFRENMAVKDVRLNGRPASLVIKNGWYYIVINESGLHTIQTTFSIATNAKTDTKMSFAIPQTAITRLALRIEKPNLEIMVSKAHKVIERNTAGGSTIMAHCSPGRNMTVSWKRKFADRKKGPAKIYAELFNLLSVEADAIRVTSKIELSILQNAIMSLSLAVPEGYQVIDVVGQKKENWYVSDDNGNQILTIPFEYPREGKQSLTVKAEKILSKETIGADFKGFQVIHAQREVGYVAGEVKSDAEANVQELEGGQSLDFQKIPKKLSSLSSRPLLFAFKYNHHPYQVVVDIIKHEKEEALSAVIDFAEGVTLLQKDGKLTHQVTYHVRNIWKQFLKIELPKDARIWSVYVDNKREKASQDAKGRLLIPLARSKRVGGKLKQFKVEIIYRDLTEKIGLLGQSQRKLPKADVLINKMNWSLYLPEEYRHGHFTGDLKSEDYTVHHPKSVQVPIAEGVYDLHVSGRSSKLNKIKEKFKRKRSEMRSLSLGGGRAQMKAAPEEFEMDMEMAAVPIEGMEDEMMEEVQHVQKAAVQPQPTDVFSPPSKRDKKYSKRLVQRKVLGKAGLLSVRPNIPLSGTSIYLGKKIIDVNEELKINYLFVHEGLVYTLWAIILLAVLWFVYLMRRKLIQIIRKTAITSWSILKKLKVLAHPKVLPISLFGAIVFIWWWGVSSEFALLFALLIAVFMITIVQFINKHIPPVLRKVFHPYKLAIASFGLAVLLAIDQKTFELFDIIADTEFWLVIFVATFLITFFWSLVIVSVKGSQKKKAKEEINKDEKNEGN